VRRTGRRSILLPALLLFVAIWPSVIVQSMDESAKTLVSWSVGLAIGAGIGVAMGSVTRHLLVRTQATNV
jgi:hypothetical protein